MLKKIMIGIIVVAAIGFAKTNKEIIDEGNVRQKTIFDKYFTSAALKSGEAVGNSAYSEVMKTLYNENRSYFDRNLLGFREIENLILDQCMHIIAIML